MGAAAVMIPVLLLGKTVDDVNGVSTVVIRSLSINLENRYIFILVGMVLMGLTMYLLYGHVRFLDTLNVIESTRIMG